MEKSMNKVINTTQLSGISLLVGLITTFVALGRWGIRPPYKKSQISPKNQAFGIWTPIFLLVIFKSLNSILNENSNEKVISLLLLTFSFLCSALWVYFASTGKRYEFAALSITLGAFMAFFSHYFEEKPADLTTWVSQAAGAMTASWLLLASTISWDFVFEVNFPAVIAPILILTISTVSIYTEKPLYMIPLIWASFFLKTYSFISILASLSLGTISFYNSFI